MVRAVRPTICRVCIVSARNRTLQHIDKVLLMQKANPVAFDQPHFLFDRECDMPVFAEHQLTVTELPQYLGELKLAEWGCAQAAPALAGIDLRGLQLEPQS